MSGTTDRAARGAPAGSPSGRGRGGTQQAGRGRTRSAGGAPGRRGAGSLLLWVAADGGSGRRGGRAVAREVEGKRTGLSATEIKDVLAEDLAVKQYFVTGELTQSIWRDDAVRSG